MTEKSANVNSEILLDNYSSKKIFKGEMKKHLSNYKIHNKFKMRYCPNVSTELWSVSVMN